MPYWTMSSISRAWVPCGKGPTSEPTAMGTPAASCFLNSAARKVSMSPPQDAAAAGSGCRAKVLEDGEGGYGVDFLLAHKAHGLVAQLEGVIDRSYSRLGGVQGSGLAGAVDADAGSLAGGFSDGGFELGLGVLVGG